MSKIFPRSFVPNYTICSFASEDSAALQGSIFEMLTLKDGWNYGQGKAPDTGTAAKASKLAQLITTAGAIKVDATPLVEGGICLSYFIQNDSFELDVQNGSDVSLAKSVNDQDDIEECEFSYLQALAHIGELPAKSTLYRSTLKQFGSESNVAKTDTSKALRA